MYSYANSNSEALLRIAEIYFRAPALRVLEGHVPQLQLGEGARRLSA